MRIGIIGDIHANLEALRAVLEVAQKNGVEKYVCTGDIVGYNANPHECLDIVRSLDMLTVVRGNHDEYVSCEKEMQGFNPQAASAIKWTRQQLSDEELKWLASLPLKENLNGEGPGINFCVVHGTLDHPEKWGYVLDVASALSSMQFQWCQLCFVGHTHHPVVFERNIGNFSIIMDEEVKLLPERQYLANVGSVGQPRDRNPRASFVIYDTESCTLKRYRVDYDIEETRRKIIAAGLPERCATRLALGR